MLACRGSRGTLEKSPFPDGDCGLSACQCRLSDSQSIITRFGCLGEQIKTCYRSEKIYRTNKMYSYVDWPPLPSLLPLRLAAIDWIHGAGIVRPYVFAHQNAARLIRRTKKNPMKSVTLSAGWPWLQFNCSNCGVISIWTWSRGAAAILLFGSCRANQGLAGSRPRPFISIRASLSSSRLRCCLY